MNSRYKSRSGFKEIARLYPYVTEIVVPPGGLGRCLDDMHQFHRQRSIKDQFLPRRRRSTHLLLLIHPCQPIVAKQQINGADWSKRCPLIVVEAAAI
jgi:hypothetical protein